MSETEIKARKGMLIVYGRDHSYNTVGLKRHVQRTWYVGIVLSTDRAGTVKTVSDKYGNPVKLDQRIPRLVVEFDKINREYASQLAELLARQEYATCEDAQAAVKIRVSEGARAATETALA